MSLWRVYLLEINLVALLLCAIDKRRAANGRWRVSEGSLLLSAALGGSAGLLLGMLLLRHKTRHKQFIFGVPAILIVQIALIYFLGY